MKNLDCEFHDGQWNNYDIVQINVNEIWQSVPTAIRYKGRVFFDKVRNSIEKNGLKFPLLVVQSTRAEVLVQKQRYNNKLRDLSFDPKTDNLKEMMYTVWGGSNRLAAARDLEYESIDCVLVESFKKAHGMQKLHRQPFRRVFY